MVKIGRWRRLVCGAALMGATCCVPAAAQSNKGTITPVDSDEGAPPKPTLHYYDKHGEKLEQPVLYLAELDTAKNRRPGSPYPLFNGVVIGANFGDAILRLTGQNHNSYDISCAVSLHNWFFPIVEAGIGWGEYTASGNDFHYKAKPSFYAKIGINYNFLYKSKPDYMAFVGLRFGMTHHAWDITDISPTSDLGKETGSTELLGQSCMSTYGEVAAGLKVKIAGPFALGWSVRYRLGLHSSKGADPWFVPGFGTGGLGINVSAFFTFGEKPRRDAIKPEINEITDQSEDVRKSENSGQDGNTEQSGNTQPDGKPEQDEKPGDPGQSEGSEINSSPE